MKSLTFLAEVDLATPEIELSKCEFAETCIFFNLNEILNTQVL